MTMYFDIAADKIYDGGVRPVGFFRCGKDPYCSQFLIAKMCFVNGEYWNDMNEKIFKIVKEMVLTPLELYCAINAYIESMGKYEEFRKCYKKYFSKQMQKSKEKLKRFKGES